MQELKIVKVGGGVVEDAEKLQALLQSFAQLPSPKILVHGGGSSATQMAERLGIKTKLVEGRRITDAAMLEVVTMVYGGLVNKRIVAALQSLQQNAIGLTGADRNIIKSNKRVHPTIDYGFVGDIEKVDALQLKSLLQEEVIPVIAPLTHDGKGTILNTNADTIAAALAVALSKLFKVELMFCFEKKGVLSNIEDEDSVIPLITADKYKKLKEEKVIVDGMIPKLDNGFLALNQGVHQIQITNIYGLIDKSGTTLSLN